MNTMRMSMPDVSVVIPSFRGGRFLRESIASVASQTLQDWELIIVLDGCEDDLSDIEQNDERVRVVRQRQRGVSIARNVGVGHARSALVAFLDDDDRMLPDRLLAQVDAMRDEKVGLCHTQFRFIDENGNQIGPGLSRESQYRDFLRDDGKILLSTTMMRRSLFQEVGGFNPLLHLGEDLDLLFRVARESTVSFLPDVLTEYRRHGGNVWLDTPVGGREIKLILTQHIWAAEARKNPEDLKAASIGKSVVLTGRANSAMFRASEARSRHDRIGQLRGLGESLLFSPIVTLRVVLKAFRRERKQNSTANT
jgi:glycosyltransferase involved in cell wall biosynthesis